MKKIYSTFLNYFFLYKIIFLGTTSYEIILIARKISRNIRDKLHVIRGFLMVLQAAGVAA